MGLPFTHRKGVGSEPLQAGGHSSGDARVFPLWLRRINPILEAEDSNALFHAFRERRKQKASKSWMEGGNPLRRLPASVQHGISILLSIAAFFLVVALLRYASIWTWIGVGMGITAGVSLASRKATHRLPLRLREVFIQIPERNQMLHDLWMTGATGQEISEALYLESVESSWKLTLRVIVAGGVWALWLLFWNAPLRPLLGIVAIVGIVWIGWELFFLFAVGGSGGNLDSVVRSLKGRLKRPWIQFARFMGAVILISFLAEPVVELIRFLGSWLDSLIVRRWEPLETVPAVALAAAVLSLAALGLRALRRPAQRHYLRRYEQLTRELTRLYPVYFYKHIVQDEESAGIAGTGQLACSAGEPGTLSGAESGEDSDSPC